MSTEIYLDNAATTKIDERVVKKMLPYLKDRFGNPSSVHHRGFQAHDAVESAREYLAKSIGANPKEIYFTSGGSEANNFALKGIAFANKKNGNHIITTKVEHKCVLKSCQWLEKQGFQVTYLDVDKEGFIDLKELEDAITAQTILVSIIHGHNEIGTIHDIEEIGRICKKHNVYFHTDACQSYTKVDIDVNKQHVDLVSLNAHKIHGPKGIGALYVKKGVNIDPLIHGGGQEQDMRGGTENVASIVGFAQAAKIALKKKHVQYMTQLRDKLIEGLLKIEGVHLNGPLADKRLANNINLSFDGIEGEAIGGLLDQKNISSSTGSACSAATLDPSYVLMAIGLSHEQANGSLRLSLSRFTTEKEIDKVIHVMPGIVQKLRRISPIGKFLKKGN